MQKTDATALLEGARFNGFHARVLPTQVRSTGLGWAMGIGRTGAIIGPVLGGALHASGLPFQASFLAFALPGLIGAMAVLVFIWRGRTLSQMRMDSRQRVTAK